MKNLKKLAAIAIIGMLGVSTAAYAVTALTPADIVSGLTGKTVQELYTQHASGKTYGIIAKEAGKLDEFKSQMLEQKKAILDQRVKDGNLTQQQADDIYNVIKNNQSNCDGTGSAAIGRNCGAGFGQGKGQGLGNGGWSGRGPGMRNGGRPGMGAGF